MPERLIETDVVASGLEEVAVDTNLRVHFASEQAMQAEAFGNASATYMEAVADIHMREAGEEDA